MNCSCTVTHVGTCPDQRIRPVSGITVRPMEPDERAYVHSTARRQAAQRNGGYFASWQTITPLVDAVLRSSDVLVAFLPGDPDNITGWAAFGGDLPARDVLEFAYLRKSMDEAKPETVKAVMEALLARCGRVVSMRRVQPRPIMDAVVMTGLTPVVKPQAV